MAFNWKWDGIAPPLLDQTVDQGLEPGWRGGVRLLRAHERNFGASKSCGIFWISVPCSQEFPWALGAPPHPRQVPPQHQPRRQRSFHSLWNQAGPAKWSSEPPWVPNGLGNGCFDIRNVYLAKKEELEGKNILYPVDLFSPQSLKPHWIRTWN